MAKEEIQVSLFSFLDILSGVIGTFALIIVGMAVISIEGTPQIVKTSGGTDKKRLPVFVETRADEMWLHKIDGGVHDIEKIPLAEIEKPVGKWKDQLTALQSQPDKRFLLILVRPNGLPVYERIRRIADEYRLAVGYDAIYEAGDVQFDVSKLKPKDGESPAPEIAPAASEGRP